MGGFVFRVYKSVLFFEMGGRLSLRVLRFQIIGYFICFLVQVVVFEVFLDAVFIL